MANVMIGVLSKREKDDNGKNSYLLFSLKNYEEKQAYEELRTNKDLSDKLTQKGDLLFRLICPNKVIYVDEKLEGLLVPNQFCIIRAIKEKMNPIVLKWYLESKGIEEELNAKATGSIIKSMTLANLRTLTIPNISKKMQEKMETMISLWEREKEVSKKILDEKERLYTFYLEEMARSEVK